MCERIGAARTCTSPFLLPTLAAQLISVRLGRAEAASFSSAVKLRQRSRKHGVVRIKRAKIDSIFLTAVRTWF